MKEKPSFEYEREVELIAEKDIDTELLMDFIAQQQSLDWKGYIRESIAKGATEELAYGFANGMLRMLDVLIEFLVEQGALREVPSNKA